MKNKDFCSKLLYKIKNRKDIIIEKYWLQYKNKKYPFLKIKSKDIGKKDAILLIRAGIHGDEIAGPLTILNYIHEIIDYAHKKNIKLIIYPLGNPSGFENGLRYNIDNDKGDVGNNDMVRYELKNNKIVDDIKNSKEFKKWYWSSDKKLKSKLPLETILFHKLLKKNPLPQIKGVIDLHQDYITPNLSAATYHYLFGNLEKYKKIIGQIKKIVPVIKNKKIGAGLTSAMKTNKDGSIIRHDGVLPDLLYRIGVKYCVTVETSGTTHLNDAFKVNLIWIFGILDLIYKD